MLTIICVVSIFLDGLAPSEPLMVLIITESTPMKSLDHHNHWLRGSLKKTVNLAEQ